MKTLPVLYIVATPIGNPEDLSLRARDVLARVQVIAAEDTRRSGQLLKVLGIATRLIAMHDHNERESANGIIKLLDEGNDVAIISDAGTPLISDPGYLVVRDCRRQGIEVKVVPGPSAVTAALSVAGMATDRFSFEGFLPAKPIARDKALKELSSEERTMVFFEAPHRITEMIQSIADVLGDERQVALCRELTKTHEQVFTGTAKDVLAALREETVPQLGEFVVVVAGTPSQSAYDADSLLVTLMSELPTSKAAAVAAKILGEPRAGLYQRALELKGKAG